MSDVYSQVVVNRTAEEVTKFEHLKNKPAFTPAWILKITWDDVMPVSFQKVSFSEVSVSQHLHSYFIWTCHTNIAYGHNQ